MTTLEPQGNASATVTPDSTSVTPAKAGAQSAQSSKKPSWQKAIWTVGLLLFVIALVIGTWPHSNGPVDTAARIAAIEQEIRCPTCSGLSIAESESPLAVSARTEVETQVQAGQTNQQIKDYFVSRYGNTALMSPPKQGITAWAWAAPVIFAIVAIGGIGYALRRWKRNEHAEDVAFVDPKPRKFTTIKLKSSKRSQQKVWGLAIAGFALIVVAAVTFTSNDRLGGENITGQAGTDTATLLNKAAQQTAASKPADAIKTYDQVLAVDPKNTQALAYKGWLIRLAGLSSQGETAIDQAIAIDPNYADARFFKGYILLRDHNDPAGAITQFDAYLANNPNGEMTALVQQARTEAASQLAAK